VALETANALTYNRQECTDANDPNIYRACAGEFSLCGRLRLHEQKGLQLLRNAVRVHACQRYLGQMRYVRACRRGFLRHVHCLRRLLRRRAKQL
jgi:hypothetical protein